MSSPAPSLVLSSTLSGRELFLTGFPGTLAQTLLAQILVELPVLGHVHLLIPSHGHHSARARFSHALSRSPAFRTLRERFGEDLGTFLSARVSIYEGDPREPFFGLDAATREDLAARLDVVVHLAEHAELNPDPRLALEHNVDAACHAVDFAAQCERAQLLLLSSLQVHGPKALHTPETLLTQSPSGRPLSAEPELIFLQLLACHEPAQGERELDAQQTRKNAAMSRAELLGYANTYAWTKALAEQLVSARAAQNPRRPVALSLLRIGHLEPAERFPFPGFFDAYSLGAALWASSQGYVRQVPGDAKHTLALVPVDHASAALVTIAAAMLAGQAAPLYQLGSPGAQALNLDRALELQSLANRKWLRESPLPLTRHIERLLDVSAHVDPQASHTPKRLRAWTEKVRAKLRHLDGQTLFPDPRSQQLRQTFQAMKVNAEWLLHEQQAQYTRSAHQLEQVQSLLYGEATHLEQGELAELALRLDEDARARFGVFAQPLHWRRYWIDILAPAFAKVLPVLTRTQHPPEDPPFALTLKSSSANDEDEDDDTFFELHEDSDPLPDWDGEHDCELDHEHGPDCGHDDDHDESDA